MNGNITLKKICFQKEDTPLVKKLKKTGQMTSGKMEQLGIVPARVTAIITILLRIFCTAEAAKTQKIKNPACPAMAGVSSAASL
jgi:hypothetical protein